MCDFSIILIFESSYDVLKSRSLYILLSKNTNFKNEAKSKMENFYDLCFISMDSVLNTISKYTYFYIAKNITLYTFPVCFENCQKPSGYP